MRNAVFHLGWIAFATLCSQIGVAVEPVKSVALVTKLDAKFFDSAQWSDAQAEFAIYDSERVIDGENAKFETLIVTAKETYSRETFSRAKFPYGQIAIIPILRQSARGSVGDAAHLHVFASDAIYGVADAELMRLQTSVIDSASNTTCDFQLWKPKPLVRASSAATGEGTQFFEKRTDAFFEEQLPVVLRALEFQEGLACDFRIYPPISEDVLKPREPSPAHLIITGSAGEWKCSIETQDARNIDIVFATDGTHVMKGMKDGDGRSLILKSVERRPAGSVSK